MVGICEEANCIKWHAVAGCWNPLVAVWGAWGLSLAAQAKRLQRLLRLLCLVCSRRQRCPDPQRKGGMAAAGPCEQQLHGSSKTNQTTSSFAGAFARFGGWPACLLLACGWHGPILHAKNNGTLSGAGRVSCCSCCWAALLGRLKQWALAPAHAAHRPRPHSPSWPTGTTGIAGARRRALPPRPLPSAAGKEAQ